jgi:hypothetical protein
VLSELVNEFTMAKEFHFVANPAVAGIKIISPKMPDDAEEYIKKHGSLNLSYGLEPMATPEFDEWAKLNGIDYELLFESPKSGIIVVVQTEEHLLWVKLRWT